MSEEFIPVLLPHVGHYVEIPETGSETLAEVICMEDDVVVYKETTGNPYPKTNPHMGHEIEIVTYAGENVSIECITCGEVIYDEEIINLN